MYVIEVIPLAKLPPQVPQFLSYFFDRPLTRGTLVKAPMGSRSIQCLVVNSSSLDDQKVTVKKSDFQLKKIDAVVDEATTVSDIQLRIALWLSKFYFAPLGACLKTVLPPFFGKKKYRLEYPQAPAGRNKQKPRVIVTSAQQILATVEPLIRQALESGGQVLLLTPEIATLEQLCVTFKKWEPLAVHSRISNSEHFGIAARLASGESKLVIGTRSALFLPFKDLTHLIVEDALNESYKSEMSPRFNAPDVAQKLTSIYSAQMTYLSPALNVEGRHWIDENEYELASPQGRSRAAISVADIGYEIRTGNFSFFSRQLQAELLQAVAEHKRILLYSARRAYSGVLLCENCGKTFSCGNCEAPMRVHKTSETLVVCYHCSTYRSVPDRCQNCQSRKLKPSGTPGSQRIKEHLKQLLDRHGITSPPIFILDSDLITDGAKEKELFEDIDKAEHPVIIATQMIFSHRYSRRFDLVGIVSADALMNTPDFRAEERFLYQLEQLSDLGPERIIIQTFNPEQKIFASAISGDHTQFLRDEVGLRKTLGYPPFSRLVKLTFRHFDKEKASQNARTVAERIKIAAARLGMTSQVGILGPSPALVGKEENTYSYNILLKLLGTIERPEVILKYIPSQWLIDADPRSIV